MQRHNFTATYITTALDIRPELIQLEQLCRRSTPAVAKQIENYVHSVWDALDAVQTATPPNATVPATVVLRAIYSDFTDFSRAVRVKVDRAAKIFSATSIAEIAQQLKDFLIFRGWTFV